MAEIFDPLRKKLVALTPEEGVRQWFIKLLHEQFGYPYSLMRSEVAFKFGEEVFSFAGGASRKTYRADIVVYNRSAKPFITVECKRPEVALDRSVAEQAMRYNSVLGVEWIVLTNGTQTLLFHRSDTGSVSGSGSIATFVPSTDFPPYSAL